MTSDHLPRLIAPETGVLSLHGFNGRGIGPGTIFGREVARYFQTAKEDDLSLQISPSHSEFLPGLQGFAIETGARLYHLVKSIL